jgi:hypothetical protein
MGQWIGYQTVRDKPASVTKMWRKISIFFGDMNLSQNRGACAVVEFRPTAGYAEAPQAFGGCGAHWI